ncbi:MAG: hypothetical protein PHC97_02020 [Patescibacteria group bacterium]|nr:hypothetical protein [Patescibacteria group bacterium]
MARIIRDISKGSRKISPKWVAKQLGAEIAGEIKNPDGIVGALASRELVTKMIKEDLEKEKAKKKKAKKRTKK